MPKMTKIEKSNESGVQSKKGNSIGLLKERSLHRSIIEWYAMPGDQLEVSVEGYVADIVRGEELIEIQTKNFAAIKHKLKSLLEHHPVQLVFPIAKEKWIIKTNPQTGQIISRRKSPKKGTLIDLFTELVRIPDLIIHKNFSLVVLLIRAEEIRCDDGKGSWRRKGVSIINRKLLEVVDKIEFLKKKDFVQFLPNDLTEPFTNTELARLLNIPVYQCRRVTYCLNKMNIIREVGRNGNTKIFQRNRFDSEE